MADIWRVYEGREPTRGLPWLSLPLDEAIALFELKPRHFISDPNRTPRFGPQDRDLSIFGYKHVIVEIHSDEMQLPKWKAGFYHSPVRPEEAFNRIIKNALVPILGETNVVRAEHSFSTDSWGRDTANVTVVLTPEARERITGEISLSTVGRLQNLFSNLGIEGAPTLQYATEDELAQNDL
jgi:hypothetical protein